ncbi:cytochrome P450 [Streptomyces sp. LaPpAH-108]|uniref:cytochrome P450 n=1 Tax=Streptomyces sp. LaPpAH-108 TaxID=1155714 RepID=UPI001319BD88|nr:cytochrome P450 [Streptomyces sp. LaPpAH-108]
MNSWVLTRYRDCLPLLTDAETFASDWTRAGHEESGSAASLQELDPPEHTPIRRLFTVAIRNQQLDRIGSNVRDLADSIISRRSRSSVSFDFTAEVARPAALLGVCELLGIEKPPVHSFAALADAMTRGMDAGLLPEVLAPALAARTELNRRIADWFDACDDQGLLSEVLTGAQNAGIPREAVWNSARVLFLAGFSTAVGAAANAVLALATHPDAFEELRGSDALRSGVDEFMRFDGPVQGTTRACVHETQIGDVTITRGDLVTALLGSANRDPEMFKNPDELVLTREPNRHLALGWGIHGCSGAILARIMIRALLESLIQNRGRLSLAEPPERLPRATLRYPDRLPLSFR